MKTNSLTGDKATLKKRNELKDLYFFQNFL